MSKPFQVDDNQSRAKSFSNLFGSTFFVISNRRGKKVEEKKRKAKSRARWSWLKELYHSRQR
jgi:hypothetical protein